MQNNHNIENKILHELLIEFFNLNELQNLCFSLNIPFEDLSGDTLNEKSRELINYAYRRSRLQDLIEVAEKERPSVNWQSVMIPGTFSGANDDVFELPADHVPTSEPIALGSRILLSRNPLFIGRDQKFLEIAKYLNAMNKKRISPTIVITGIGGIGKTQLAVEFAHLYGQYYRGGVFWLSFADIDAVAAEVAACGRANALNLDPDFDNLPQITQVGLVQRAWNEPIPRLLIFDNCEDETLLATWRPKIGGCHILVTSRRGNWDRALGVSNVSLDVLSRSESVKLLNQFVLQNDSQEELNLIAQELNDFPLALHLAGSFLNNFENTPFGSPGAYLEQLKKASILDHPSLKGELSSYSPTGDEMNVSRTFSLSYSRLKQDSPVDQLALKLLYRAACFAPGEPISSILLFSSVGISHDDLTLSIQAKKSLDRLINLGLLERGDSDMLKRLGLLKRDESGVLVFLHGLLAEFVKKHTPTTSSAQTDVEYALLTTLFVRRDTSRYIGPLPMLQTHLQYVTQTAQSREDENVADLCNWLAVYYKEIGEYRRALPYHRLALKIHEKVFGLEHPVTASTLNDLGYLLRAMGNLTEAEECHKRSLDIRKEKLGYEHPDIATTLNNLAYVYYEMRDFQKAKPYYEQALAIREKVLGPAHPDTARSLNCMGYLLRTMGEYDKSLEYQERALDIQRQALQPNHPHTARSLNNMGVLLHYMGNYEKAESFLKEGLAIREKELGKTHPEYARNLNDLGLLLITTKRYEKAKEALDDALDIRKRTLGIEHHHTARSLNNLGNLYKEWGKTAEALLYYGQAFAIFDKIFGPEHFYTSIVKENLAQISS